MLGWKHNIILIIIHFMYKDYNDDIYYILKLNYIIINI